CGVRDKRHELAVAQIVGEAVVPTGDGVLGVAFRAHRERHAAVGAAILDRVNPSIDALEQDAFAEHLLSAALPLGQLAAEERRVPVIAEAEARLEVSPPWPAPDLAALGRGRGLAFRR